MTYEVRIENHEEAEGLGRSLKLELPSEPRLGDVIAVELDGQEEMFMLAVTGRLIFVEGDKDSEEPFRESHDPLYKARLMDG